MANEDLSFVVALPPVILYFLYSLHWDSFYSEGEKKKNLFSKTVLSILSLLPEDLQIRMVLERDQRSLPKVLTGAII